MRDLISIHEVKCSNLITTDVPNKEIFIKKSIISAL